MSSPSSPLINPQAIAALSQLFPQVQGSAAPATPAPAAPAPGDISQEMIEASRQGRQTFGAETAKVGALGGQAEELVKQQAATPIPKMGWTDTQGQAPQGGFLHNLGRALMTIGAATVPGREIQAAQYGPGIRRYEAETGARAKQIEELRGQQEEAGKMATAGASMVSKPITAAGAYERGAAAVQNAASRAQAVVNQHADALAKINAMKDIASKRNATMVEVTRMRDEMMTQITSMKDVTQEDVANIMANSAQTIINTKFANDPSLWGDIKRVFGVGAAMAPGGEQPVQGAAPLPPKKSAAKPTAAGAAQYRRDPQTNKVQRSTDGGKTWQ